MRIKFLFLFFLILIYLKFAFGFSFSFSFWFFFSFWFVANWTLSWRLKQLGMLKTWIIRLLWISNWRGVLVFRVRYIKEMIDTINNNWACIVRYKIIRTITIITTNKRVINKPLICMLDRANMARLRVLNGGNKVRDQPIKIQYSM